MNEELKSNAAGHLCCWISRMFQENVFPQRTTDLVWDLVSRYSLAFRSALDSRWINFTGDPDEICNVDGNSWRIVRSCNGKGVSKSSTQSPLSLVTRELNVNISVLDKKSNCRRAPCHRRTRMLPWMSSGAARLILCQVGSCGGAQRYHFVSAHGGNPLPSRNLSLEVFPRPS